MTVGHGNANALRGDHGSGRLYDLTVLYRTPNTQGLLLGLFFLTANEGNDVVDHFGPLVEGLAGTGDCLIGGDYHFLDAKILNGGQRGYVALNRAVGLNRDKAALGAQSLLLCLDDLVMVSINLRDHHGNVGSPAVCAVIGDHGDLCLGVRLLQSLDLILLHIDSAENKGNELLDSCDVLGADNDHVLIFFGQGSGHFPSAVQSLLVGFTRITGRRDQSGDFKIGVILKQGQKTLTNHARCANDADFAFFHSKFSLR